MVITNEYLLEHGFTYDSITYTLENVMLSPNGEYYDVFINTLQEGIKFTIKYTYQLDKILNMEQRVIDYEKVIELVMEDKEFISILKEKRKLYEQDKLDIVPSHGKLVLLINNNILENLTDINKRLMQCANKILEEYING
jgi:hypothetical protein